MSLFDDLKKQPIVKLSASLEAKMNSPQFKKDVSELKRRLNQGWSDEDALSEQDKRHHL